MSIRILTFLHSFETGGVERTALRLVEQWQADGIEAPLWLGRTDGPMRAAHEGRVHYEAGPKTRLPVGCFETLWMTLLLPGVIRRLRPDLLLCAGNSYAVVAVAMKLLLGRNCPPIVAKISNDLVRKDMPLPARRAYHFWLRVQGRIIDHFVGMAEPMRAELCAMLGVRETRVSIIADPVLDRTPTPEPKQHSERKGLRFITVGRLAPQKDQELMLRAFAAGSQPEDSLCVVGDGPLEGALRECAMMLGIEKRVTFVGHCSNVALLLAECDIFVLSSRYEGVPAVVIEALAAGLPVISTDCAVSIRALLHHGTFGMTTPVGQLQPLADAIASARSLMIDREAAARSVNRFTTTSSAREYVKLFHSVSVCVPRDAALTTPIQAPTAREARS